jgi:hypothetical protein
MSTSRRIAVSLLAVTVIGATAAPVLGWSGGPLFDVTDLTPNCAACHSSVTKEQGRTEPAGIQNYYFLENRHYKAIEGGTGPYQAMSQEDRQKLLADVKLMDQNASVTLTVPATVKAGQDVQVTVTVKGGNEVVGVALVDTDLRLKARIIQAHGWEIVGPPKVRGSDGAEQTKWMDPRGPLTKNINSAVIFDQKADLAAKRFAAGTVTWTLKAPLKPGTYSMSAAFFYGTEKASPSGRVTVGPQVSPRGGTWGHSGRVMLARPASITVQ